LFDHSLAAMRPLRAVEKIAINQDAKLQPRQRKHHRGTEAANILSKLEVRI
jgi:hypothetical protein